MAPFFPPELPLPANYRLIAVDLLSGNTSTISSNLQQSFKEIFKILQIKLAKPATLITTAHNIESVQTTSSDAGVEDERMVHLLRAMESLLKQERIGQFGQSYSATQISSPRKPLSCPQPTLATSSHTADNLETLYLEFAKDSFSSNGSRRIPALVKKKRNSSRFMILPLEIRHLIFSNLLPYHQVIHLGKSASNTGFGPLSKTCSQLNVEIKLWFLNAERLFNKYIYRCDIAWGRWDPEDTSFALDIDSEFRENNKDDWTKFNALRARKKVIRRLTITFHDQDVPGQHRYNAQAVGVLNELPNLEQVDFVFGFLKECKSGVETGVKRAKLVRTMWNQLVDIAPRGSCQIPVRTSQLAEFRYPGEDLERIGTNEKVVANVWVLLPSGRKALLWGFDMTL